MGNSIFVDFQALDFESAVDEVDVIVPKYLEALAQLESVVSLDKIPESLQHVEAYWKRLASLFMQMEPLETEVPFQEIMMNSLQSELSALEKVYLMINLRIEFSENQWTKAMWSAAHAVLGRMDIVLEALGFADEHEDRLLIQEMLVNNALKEQRWRRRNKAVC
jgi:hypothetical protein